MLEKLPEIVGHALRDQRAGLDKLAMEQIGLRGGMGTIEVKSLAFVDHAPIPALYTADGPGTSPPLQWSGVPASTTQIVLVVEDADAPTPQPLVHAIAVGLAGEDGSLPEGALSEEDHRGVRLVAGRNSYLRSSWLPPDPPPGHGVHRYAFQLFALGQGAAFSDTPGREEVLDALRERATASGCLIGTYARPDGSQKDEAPSTAPLAQRGIA